MAAMKKLTDTDLNALLSRFRQPAAKNGSDDRPSAASAYGTAEQTEAMSASLQHSSAVNPGSSKVSCSFEDFPAYKQLQIQLRVAQRTGIGVPYFMLHQGLAKEYTEADGKRLLNFSTYDYLGLNGDSRLTQAATQAALRYGTSASASRLVAGERPVHRELEVALAEHYGTEDCVVMVSGYACNATTIASLFGPGDVIYADRLSHSSIMNGAKDSMAARLIYQHNDMQALRQLLETTRVRHNRALIVTEGVFSMDGNIAALRELIALKREFNCFLMVDEAHALGCIGATGAGSGEYWHVAPQDVDIWMGTLSKTLCTCGGYIAGNKALITLLKYKAPGFVYSVGMSPVLAAASLEALKLMHAETWRTEKLQENCSFAFRRAQELGLDTGKAEGTAILPVITGSSMKAGFLSSLLLEHGVCALPIIYPVVSENSARIRLFLSASHSKEHLKQALTLIASLLPEAEQKERQFISKVQNSSAQAQIPDQAGSR